MVHSGAAAVLRVGSDTEAKAKPKRGYVTFAIERRW